VPNTVVVGVLFRAPAMLLLIYEKAIKGIIGTVQ